MRDGCEVREGLQLEGASKQWAHLVTQGEEEEDQESQKDMGFFDKRKSIRHVAGLGTRRGWNAWSRSCRKGKGQEKTPYLWG